MSSYLYETKADGAVNVDKISRKHFARKCPRILRPRAWTIGAVDLFFSFPAAGKKKRDTVDRTKNLDGLDRLEGRERFDCHKK